MQPDLNRVIEQVSKEKGMDRSVIIEALESAMLSAARRTFGQKEIEAKFNPDIGEIELFEIQTVVETVTNPESEVDLHTARTTLDPEARVGDQLLKKLHPSAFGRIAAQVAKQSVIQKVREAERELIYNEFKNRKGELFSGIVQRLEKKDIIVNLGRTDAVLRSSSPAPTPDSSAPAWPRSSPPTSPPTLSSGQPSTTLTGPSITPASPTSWSPET
jgi:N utilization substance protein A